MQIRSRALRGAGVLTVTALTIALSACDSGDDNGSGTSTPSESAASSSTPSAAPTVTPKPASPQGPAENLEPPELPDEIMQKDAAGMEATLEYWLDAHNYGQFTGDVEPMNSVVTENCIFCANRVGFINETYDRGAWVTGAEVRLADFYGEPDTELADGGYRAFTTFSLNAGKVYISPSKVDEDFPIADGQAKWSTIFVFDEKTGWRIDSISAPAGSE